MNDRTPKAFIESQKVLAWVDKALANMLIVQNIIDNDHELMYRLRKAIREEEYRVYGSYVYCRMHLYHSVDSKDRSLVSSLIPLANNSAEVLLDAETVSLLEYWNKETIVEEEINNHKFKIYFLERELSSLKEQDGDIYSLKIKPCYDFESYDLSQEKTKSHWFFDMFK